MEQDFDLALTKVVAEAGPFFAGDTVTFTISIFNQGSLDATGVQIQDYVPSNMTNVDPDWTTGNVYMIGNLAAGAMTTVDVDLKIDDAFQGATLANNAEIIAGTNALGLTDEDDDIATIDGSTDDTSSLPTNDDVADESNGGADNPADADDYDICLLYTSPSPRDATLSRMPSSA